MEGMLNLVRREVRRVLGSYARDRIGIIDSYDPATHRAKVRYQPEDSLSGWLPVASMATGNGFGVHFAPNQGDQVQVHFLDGVFDSGVVGLRLYSDEDQPLNVPAGELWIAQKSGSAIRMHGDGSVDLVTIGKLTATIGGDLDATVTGKVQASASEFDLTGNTNITGDLTVTGATKFGTGSLSPVETAAGPSTTSQAV